MIKLEFISIYKIVQNIKNEYKFQSKEEIRDSVKNILSEGVFFKNHLIKTFSKNYYNKFSELNDFQHYFRCPKCDSNVRKIYFLDKDNLGCRKCCKIKSKTKINSQADKILRIQKYMGDIFSPEISSKKKRQLSKNIINHYNKLDDKYKFAYNTFVFKEIQNWCLNNLTQKNLSSDYKKAIKDMLEVLQNSKKILIETGLAKKNKKDFNL
jgi:hypothetical protein